MSAERNGDDLLRLVLLVLAVVLLAPIFMMALAVPLFGMWGGMMGGYSGSSVHPIWGVGMSLFWLVVLVGGGYIVYRWVSARGVAITDPALEELRLAYARGEISEEEFEDRREKLGRD